jgi:glutamate formiminotransferase/formiminotetrahydrofolate cyclodeaminase
VGLVPARAISGNAEARFKLREPVHNHIIEEKVRESEGQSLEGFLDAISSSTPAPGGGAAAAVAGAMGASLAAMVSGLTIGRKKYADVEPEFKAIQARALELRATLMQLGKDDSAAYEKVFAAYKLPKEDAMARNVAIQQALIEAMVVPMKTLEASLGVARCAARAASKGNSNAASDAGVAALLAGAAARGAAYNVRINAGLLVVKEQGQPMVEQTATLLAEVEKYVKMATDAVEANIGA